MRRPLAPSARTPAKSKNQRPGILLAFSHGVGGMQPGRILQPAHESVHQRRVQTPAEPVDLPHHPKQRQAHGRAHLPRLRRVVPVPRQAQVRPRARAAASLRVPARAPRPPPHASPPLHLRFTAAATTSATSSSSRTPPSRPSATSRGRTSRCSSTSGGPCVPGSTNTIRATT